MIMTDQSNPQVSATIQTLLTSVFNEMGTMLAQQNVQALSPIVTANDSLAWCSHTRSRPRVSFPAFPTTSISLLLG